MSSDERVLRGAAALDLHGPSDWRDRVDVSVLDVAHSELCVLGQVFGDYWSTASVSFRERAGVHVGNVHEYGFDVLTIDVREARSALDRCDELNRGWRAELLDGGD